MTGTLSGADGAVLGSPGVGGPGEGQAKPGVP